VHLGNTRLSFAAAANQTGDSVAFEIREIARERARKRTSGHQRTAIEGDGRTRSVAPSELRRPLSDRARKNGNART
jgi:hypothetical protein